MKDDCRMTYIHNHVIIRSFVVIGYLWLVQETIILTFVFVSYKIFRRGCFAPRSPVASGATAPPPSYATNTPMNLGHNMEPTDRAALKRKGRCSRERYVVQYRSTGRHKQRNVYKWPCMCQK